MQATDCIKTRRSVRRFSEQVVSEEVIARVVEAASFAPTWKNTQTVRYYAVLDQAVRSRIAREGVLNFSWNEKIIEGAPVLVVMTSKTGISGYEKDGTFSTSKEKHWQSFDAGCCAEAFCLAAHDAGLGTVILGVIDEPAIREILSLPEDEEIAALIPLGYPAEEPKAPRRKPVGELLHVI